jgi:hypothetical protein
MTQNKSVGWHTYHQEVRMYGPRRGMRELTWVGPHGMSGVGHGWGECACRRGLRCLSLGWELLRPSLVLGLQVSLGECGWGW